MRRTGRIFGLTSPTALLVALLMLMSTEAMAATRSVSIGDNFYDPGVTVAVLGDIVEWTNHGENDHTVTSDGSGNGEVVGMHFFFAPEGFASRFFNWAGSFPYHCSIHGRMRGRVNVRMQASPRAGQVGERFVIRWGVTNPEGFVFDVVFKEPGDRLFKPFRTGTTAIQSRLFPEVAGDYAFMTRVRDPADGGPVGPFSPQLRVRITT